MPLTFYPHPDDLQKATLEERIELLAEAAERYKAVVTEEHAKTEPTDPNKRMVPREIISSYNWEEIARTLREIREMPEGTPADRTNKAKLLTKLSEVYEVLRAARMSKLEAVRLALVNEAKQLSGG